jgi:catechol 2,3-dioxygenase-like lactoylglutathione lyase family enzyme
MRRLSPRCRTIPLSSSDGLKQAASSVLSLKTSSRYVRHRYVRPTDTLVQLFCLFSPGLVGSRYEPGRTRTADEHRLSELESSMSSVQIDQKTYEMPPRDGFTVTHFITVADIDRSAGFYEKVFGGRILSRGDSKGASGHIQIANTWLIINVGGGPTPDKPSVTLSVPADPDKINSFMNIRVADIQACYELWRGRGAEFITEPIPKYGEIRCYIRDPDGYIIEVGQSTELK